MLIVCCSLWATAGSQFEPKPFDKTALAHQFDQYDQLYLPDLFDYPDGMDGTEDFSKEDSPVKISVSSDNENILQLYQISYNYQNKMQVMLKRPAKAAGTVNVTISLAYNGETIDNVLKFDYRHLIMNDISDDITLGKEQTPTDIAVLPKIQIWNNDEWVSAKVEVLDEPQFGTIEVARATVSYREQDVIRYTPAENVPNYSVDKLKFKVTLSSGESGEGTLTVNLHKNSYATKIIEFMPAPGQFTNTSTAGNTEKTLNGMGGLVSLGSFGGYIVYGFDQPIKNNPQNPYGVDFSIKGNSFVAGVKGVWTEPGAVMVMKDLNGNGIPDDGEWYELAGSDYWLDSSHRNIKMTYQNPKYNARKTVPWTTDNGLAGAVLTNNFHQQAYYPDPDIYGNDRDSLTLSGTLIRCSLDKRVPSYIEFYRCPAFGYFDNKNVDDKTATNPKNPYYDDEKGKSEDGFDISWAVDKDGNHVELDQIDFVKVYTAGAVNAGWLGEWSSEIAGIAITTPDPDYVPRDYYINYVGINQLQVPVGGKCHYQGLVFKNGRPVNEGTPVWTVEDESVGTIDKDGMFTGRKIGTTKIHFKQYADAEEDVFDIEVVKLGGVLIDIEGNASKVSNDSILCIVNETIYLNVESETTGAEVINGTKSNRYIYDTYKWSNSNPEVGSIDNGTFKAFAPGKTTLIVASDWDKTLTDTIVVTVNPVPDVTLAGDKIKVPYYSPVGTLANNAIFKVSTGAAVFMDEFKTDTESTPVKLDGNKVTYEFEEGKYMTDSVTIKTNCYGIDKIFRTAISYGPDNLAMPRQLIFADSAIKGVALNNNDETTSYINNIASANDIITEGGYIWVATDNSLARYNVSNGKKVAEKALTTGTRHHVAIIEDRVIVNNADSLMMLYKTDLAPVASVKLAGPVATFDVSGNSLFTVSGNDNTVINKIDLNAFSKDETEIIASNTTNHDANIVAMADDKAYLVSRISGWNMIQPYSFASQESETTTHENSSSRMKRVADTTSDSPVVIKAENKILVGDTDGFKVYNTETNTWESTPVMPLDGKEAAAAIYDNIDAKYYIFDGGDVNIYDNRFVKGETIKTNVTSPTALTLMEATIDNEAPVGSTSKPQLSIYEYSNPGNTNIAATTLFTDKERNVTIYARDMERHNSWLSTERVASNGNIRLSYNFTGTVNNDSIVTIPLEGIDTMGESAMKDYTITVKPRIYRPEIVETPLQLVADDRMEYRIPFKQFFVDSKNKYSVTFTYAVAENELNPAVTATVDEANPEYLIIKAAKGTNIDGEIVLSNTITHSNQSYLPKTFLAHIPVKVVSELSGIDSVDGDGISLIYNATNDCLETNDNDGDTVEVYNASGMRVISTGIDASTPVELSGLARGFYIANYKNKSIKLILK